MPTSSSLVTPQVVITTTCGATSDDKVGIIRTLDSQWLNIITWWRSWCGIQCPVPADGLWLNSMGKPRYIKLQLKYTGSLVNLGLTCVVKSGKSRNFYPTSQIAKLMGQTWGPPGSCRPQMGPMLAPWTLLSGLFICLNIQDGDKSCLTFYYFVNKVCSYLLLLLWVMWTNINYASAIRYRNG